MSPGLKASFLQKNKILPIPLSGYAMKTGGMTTIFQGKNLRKGRCSQIGQTYLVTCVTAARSPFFQNHQIARHLCRAIQYSDQIAASPTWCYVVMPDHMHWLFSLQDSYTLSQTVRMIKSRASRLAGIPLWQRGFHDHALGADKDLLPTARYIIANPLRAGLVERVGEYPYWNAAWV